MNQLQNIKDELAIEATGITRDEAHTKGICIRCKQPPVFFTYLGRKEYGISGMCEPCFDYIMTHPDDCCAVCELPVEHHTNKIVGTTHEYKNKEITEMEE